MKGIIFACLCHRLFARVIFKNVKIIEEYDFRAELEATYAKGLSKLSSKLTKACTKDQGNYYIINKLTTTANVYTAIYCIGARLLVID